MGAAHGSRARDLSSGLALPFCLPGSRPRSPTHHGIFLTYASKQGAPPGAPKPKSGAFLRPGFGGSPQAGENFGLKGVAPLAYDGDGSTPRARETPFACGASK